MESLLLFVILLALSGSQRLTEAPPTSSIQVRAGEDATLQCPLLDGSNSTTANLTSSWTGLSTLSWYRKSAGRRPELLVTFRSAHGSNVTYGTAVGPDKVSAAADGSLLLRDSKQSDSALYFCGISQGSVPNKEPKLQNHTGD